MNPLPVGKLPPELLHQLLSQIAPGDPRVLLGPGIGLDCAVIDFGDQLLVAKSDPVTFTAEELGWYAVHVNANDVATTGAAPRWFLGTLFLPEGKADEQMASAIFEQINEACCTVGAHLVGGHTEITSGIDRAILSGTMLGEVSRDSLITPRGARPGDLLLLTKGVPIEATSILAREFADRLSDLPQSLLERARGYLRDPGISVVREALAAAKAGGVTAMHDPTEGGLAAGLWELAQASGHGLEVELANVLVLPDALALCRALDVEPLEAIASGALLLAVDPARSDGVMKAIHAEGIAVTMIGRVVDAQGVWFIDGEGRCLLRRPARDALALLLERS